MLSEEEKKAIEKLKETQDSYLKDELDLAIETVLSMLKDELDLAIETVLSMLKEKDKQINSKNGTINALQCALKERTEERDRKDDIITKQNKIIDLMAEVMFKSNKPQLLIEYGIENKEQIIKDFEQLAKEKGE